MAFDISQSMLDVASKKLERTGRSHWKVQVAVHRRIPVSDDSADIVVSGWSIFYLGKSSIPNWEYNIHQFMNEAQRVLRSDGLLIIFETLGTRNETPIVPNNLENYYRLLEEHFGFQHKWIRTDYKFKTLGEANDLTRFFFGDELADRVLNDKMLILPECTGIWWLGNI